jgi:hypothetical protein
MMHAEELSRLFAAERAVLPPPAALEHGLARLLPVVAANVAPPPVAGGVLKLTWTAVSKWILAGFVIGVAGSGAAARVWAPAGAPTSTIDAVAARVAAPGASAVAPSAPVSSLGVPASSAEPSFAPRASLRAATEPTPSNEPTRFDAELRLITLAKSELDAGRPHLAQAWLAEHAARFPLGVFAMDREALSVLVGCSERRDEGAARRFAASHRGSPMLDRLLRACGAEPNAGSVNEEPTLGEPTHEVGKQ